MVYASNEIVPHRMAVSLYGNIIFAVLLLALMNACTTVEKPQKPVITDTVIYEPRESLLSWHDATHKSYYGLRGPVKTLTTEPVAVSEMPDQIANDGWELGFNKAGRLIHKKRNSEESVFETTYAYSENNKLKYVSTTLDGKLWRTSSFIYENGRLVRVDFIDQQSGDKFSMLNDRQSTHDGWFEIQSPVEKTELPSYTEYKGDGRLVWSNKGDIANGLGELFYLRTVDNVTSSSVAHQGTEKMVGRGGYRYHYDKNGLLESVESYSAHNNRLFHTTSYQYDELWQLSSEEKRVTGSSPFNQAIDERVDYQYLKIDRYGNWLERKLDYQSRFQSIGYIEKRAISYYPQ